MRRRILLPLRSFFMQPAVQGLGPFVLLVIVWALVVELEVYPRAFFPGPLDVLRAFGSLVYKGILPTYLQDSVTRLAVGAGVGMLVGVPLGLLIGLHPASYRFFWPLIIFFQAIGDIAWLPILLIWFGFTLTTMTFVIVYTVIFPMIFNAALGVRTVPVEMILGMIVLGILWYVVDAGVLRPAERATIERWGLVRQVP